MAGITVVGIGPGSLLDMTPRARAAIERAEVVAGYTTYIRLIEPLLAGQSDKEVIGTGMMQEIDRMSAGKITFNTLYQAIYRLQSFQYIQEEGKVVSEDNRVRIYFAITASGVDYLEKLIEEYRSFTGAVDQILDQENSNTIRIGECS